MEKFRHPKTLRGVTIVVLLHAILVVFSQLLLLVGTFMKDENPLIPKQMSEYVLFPIYFLLPIFIGIIIYCSSSLLKNKFSFSVVLWLTVFSILYFAFGGELYTFMQSFHPYHNSVNQ